MQPADLVGWAASAVLLATIGRQVWKQWKERREGGVSRWLFIGQMTASAGFLVYSWMLQNWVFVASNFFLLLAAVAGQAISMRNRRDAPASRSQGAASTRFANR
jgi:MtN3 and saliva related transmembrane protein